MQCRAAAGVVLQPGQLHRGARIKEINLQPPCPRRQQAIQHWQHSQAASHLGARVKGARIHEEVLSNVQSHLLQEPVWGRGRCALSGITVAFQQRSGVRSVSLARAAGCVHSNRPHSAQLQKGGSLGCRYGLQHNRQRTPHPAPAAAQPHMLRLRCARNACCAHRGAM